MFLNWHLLGFYFNSGCSITQASLFLVVFVPACSFFESLRTPRCLLFLVMINSKNARDTLCEFEAAACDGW